MFKKYIKQLTFTKSCCNYLLLKVFPSSWNNHLCVLWSGVHQVWSSHEMHYTERVSILRATFEGKSAFSWTGTLNSYLVSQRPLSSSQNRRMVATAVTEVIVGVAPQSREVVKSFPYCVVWNVHFTVFPQCTQKTSDSNVVLLQVKTNLHCS